MLNRICTKILWRGFSENFIFVLYTFSDDSNFWKKCSYSSKKLVLSKKLPISHGESFLESFFDLSQIYKIYCLYKTVKFGTVTQLICFIFSLKFGKMLWWYTKCQKIKVWSRQGRVETITLLGQAILDKKFGTNKEI